MPPSHSCISSMAHRRCLSSPVISRTRALPLSRRTLHASRIACEELPEAKTEMNRAERTLRRFWKSVGVNQRDDGRFGVTLDSKNLKTPDGQQLTLPDSKSALAALVALEWDNQDQVLRQHTLPLTSLVSRALDGFAEDDTKFAVISDLLRYLQTDTVLFHEEFPERLVTLQKEHWDPLIKWVNQKYGVSIAPHTELFGSKLPTEVTDKLAAAVAQFDIFKLAAFEKAVHTSKSFIIALALVEGHITVDQAAQAAHVEVQSQIDRWGEVEDTHDVDHQDVRVRLGSAAMMLL